MTRTSTPPPTRPATGPAATSPGSARGAAGNVRRDALITAALAYAARGWRIFPLRPGDKRPAFPNHPADRCDRTDPRCRGGHTGWEQRSTTDPNRITRAWSTPPPHGPYGIGIACGPSRLLVADLDVPKPGAAPLPVEWAEPGIICGSDVWCLLAERAGQPVPLATYAVRTPTGGLHLYFTAPAGTSLRNTAGTLAPMVDTRAHGGYVAAPPTTLPTGAYVTLDDGPAAPLPGWLTERLTPAPVPEPAREWVRFHGGDKRTDRYVNQAVNGQLRLLRETVEGGRNHALFMGAQTLGQLVAGGHLSAEDVTAVLAKAARGIGLDEREITRTITSGLRAGAKRPRSIKAAA